jgi:hypothetical protein
MCQLQIQSAPNSRGGDGSQGVLVQTLDHIDNPFACDRRIIELFADVREVAVGISSRHVNHRLERRWTKRHTTQTIKHIKIQPE